MHRVKVESIGSAFLTVDREAGTFRLALKWSDAEAVELAVWERVHGLDTDGD